MSMPGNGPLCTSRLFDSSSAGADAPAYPVFVPRPSNVKEVGKQGAWSWADDGDEGRFNDGTPPLPEWNPQTGFLSSKASGPQPSSSSSSRSVQGSPVPSPAQSGQEPLAAAGSGRMEDLPYVSKNAVRGAEQCYSTLWSSSDCCRIPFLVQPCKWMVAVILM
eukprot:1160656-Pelagomonas_calceolata.AAC.2